MLSQPNLIIDSAVCLRIVPYSKYTIDKDGENTLVSVKQNKNTEGHMEHHIKMTTRCST